MFWRSCARLVCGIRPVVHHVLAVNTPSSLMRRCAVLSRLPVQTHSTAYLHCTTVRYSEHVINIQNEEDFNKRVLSNETPVIVDFHADWCGPCKILGPRLEKLVGNKEGKVVLAKVDIDSNADLAMEHGVQAVPTVLAMKAGRVVDKFVGVKDDSQLQSFINGLSGD